MEKLKSVKVIAFDADDTLWVNEPYFRVAEQQFCELMAEFMPAEKVNKELYKIEMQNMELYGYGAKAFTLSLVEAALKFSNGKVAQEKIERILSIGRYILDHPVELLDDVKELLDKLKGCYRLLVVTKGDLLEQERKLVKSGLVSYFDHIEIFSDKKEDNYKRLFDYLDIRPDEFLMVGNSLKSDILPVVSLGGKGVYVPFHTTWLHEVVEVEPSLKFYELGRVGQLAQLLDISE
ncbi:MAG: HAD family hydrolase [Bacteroidales bacterium]|nr:HAD family hydrolase [Bacteroidales bacterium]